MMEFYDDTTPSRLAEQVKREIAGSHRNLYRLARDAQTQYRQLCRFMNGEVRLPRSVLLKLAGQLGVSLQQAGKTWR